MLNQDFLFSYDLIQSITEGIIAIDPQRRITFFNRGAERITGWNAADVLRQPLGQIFPEMIGEKGLLEYLGSDRAALPITIHHHQGQEIALAVTNATFRPAGSSEGQIALVFRDVTETDAAQRLRTYFLGNISHEFRTPLSALKASVELLLEEMPDLSQEETASLLNSIHFSLIGLQTLIDNLLESVSIEAGRFQIRKRPTELKALAAEAAKIMRPLLERRKQALKISVDPQLPLVEVDPMRMSQVLINLLSNASKYGPIEKTIELTLALQGEHVRVSVADRGDGIPEDERQNIFRRFVRLDHKNKPQYGIGLGLSLVKTIVEEHGGSVGLDERPGGGSIFWFTVPLLEEAA